MQQQTRHNRFILGLLSIGLLVMAALTASPAQAASGPGPYYAEPAWDLRLACPTIANCPRFLILKNMNSAAVLDKETGLVWERSPNGSAPWLNARFACTARTTGNRKGWRLPTIHELASLIDVLVLFPAPKLPPGHPFLVPGTFFWSATTLDGNTANAWQVELIGGVEFDDLKTVSSNVWCVRGANRANAY